MLILEHLPGRRVEMEQKDNICRGKEARLRYLIDKLLGFYSRRDFKKVEETIEEIENYKK